MPVLIAAVAFLAMLLLCIPDRYLPFRSRRLEKQLARVQGTKRVQTTARHQPPLLFRLGERLTPKPLVQVLDTMYGLRQRERFQQQVVYARLEGRVTWHQFLALKVMVPAMGIGYLALIAGKSVAQGKSGIDPSYLIAATIPIIGFFVPDQWLRGSARRRQHRIELELPAVLTTLAITTEAGLGLSAALEEVARSHSGVLADEFRSAAEQVSLGTSHGQALEAMASRCGVTDLTMFVSALVQSFEKGSAQVASTLRTQAHEAWEKRRHRAEELAQTASVRLFLPLVFLVMPAVIIFLLGPALITISDFFSTGIQ